MNLSKPLLSVVVPVYNEEAGLKNFHKDLCKILQKHYKNQTEIIYVNDGSRDNTAAVLKTLQDATYLQLTRNFGKEIATTAGIHAAKGQAILTLDGDGQHPVELIPEFVKRWQAGAKVVVGRRTANQKEGLIKRWGSKIFYASYGKVGGVRLTPGATDFRLIDQTVQQEFAKLTERNRITRGLIDWLGYPQTLIDFTAKPRQAGQATYSTRKLVKLALDSAISLSISPLYITAYIGAVVLPLATLLGIGMLGNWLLGDPLGFHATGSAYLGVMLLFLVGLVLVSQGIIGLYLSHIHAETQARPLYIIDREQSKRA